MFNRKNRERGFTLIELLIVIAIIGVLAATVVVSLGDQTSTAKKETTKIGVSSVRSLATAEVASPKDGTSLTGTKLCANIHEHVSAKDKSAWAWKFNNSNVIQTCNRLTLLTDSGTRGKEGEICCHSKGKKWIIWGAMTDSDGTTGTTKEDVYCADSTGFLGTVQVVPGATRGADGDDKASIKSYKDAVQGWDATANGGKGGFTAGDTAVLRCST